MTNRERLLAVLDGQSVDRVPMWLLFPYHPTSYYVDVRRSPRYWPIYERSKERAVMLNRRNPRVNLYPAVTGDTEEWTENGECITRQHWRYRDIHLYSDVIRGSGTTRLKKLLDSDADLEQLARLPVETDPAAVHRQLDAWLPQYLGEKREFPVHYGSMMLDLGEPINFLYQQSNLESFSIWSLTQSDRIVGLLEQYMRHKRAVYTYCLERDLADVYFMVGSELASPPLVSRRTFQKWIVPYGKELVDLIHSYDKKVIMHYHGQIKSILEDFLTMGPDGLHTVEAPPVGDCTLDEAFSVLGDAVTLIGNVQYDCFRSYSVEEMADEVRRIIDEAAGRRFILSPTAGPFDADISPSMVQNYLAFLDTGWAYGKY